MARSSSEETAAESYRMTDALDADGSSRGSSRFPPFEDEDDYYFNYVQDESDLRRQPSSFSQMLDFVGVNGRGRRRANQSRSGLSGEALHGLLARPATERTRRRLHRESRSCRRGFVMSTLKKSLLTLPFVVLMLFGLLHIVQSVFGTADLLWDYDDNDLFLPDWGRPGAIGSGLAQYPTDATRDVLPIPCHSHNDYWRRIPLLEAVHWGCTSIEADVWLFDDDLFVGHATTALSRARTLRTLYITPLIELLDSMNGPDHFVNGTKNATRGIFDEDPSQTLVLLVDIKSEPHAAFTLLEAQLEQLRKKDYLTYHDGKNLVKRPVTVVGTGRTPFDVIQSSNHTDIFFDAPLDLFWEAPASPIVPSDANDKRPSQMDYATAMIRAPANESTSDRPTFESSGDQGHVGVSPSATADDFDISNSFYASTSFSKSVGFVWRGHLSPRQMEIVRGHIRGAKRRQLKVRYWDTPSWPASLRNHVWQVLMDEGADILSVDDLKGAATEDWRRRVHRWWS